MIAYWILYIFLLSSTAIAQLGPIGGGGNGGGGGVSSVNGATGVVTVLTPLADATKTVLCDGTTDDTAALAALGAVAGSNPILPKNCTSVVGNLVITGANVNFSGNGTTWKTKAGTSGVMVFGTTGTKITGVTFDGNHETGLTALVQVNSSSVRLDNDSFINSGTPAVGNFQGGLVLFQDTGSTVSNSVFTNIAGYAAKCDTCTGTVFQANKVRNAYKNGWYITGSTGVRSIGNTMDHIYDFGGSSTGAAGNGIDFAGGTTSSSSVGDTISYTEYSSVRIAASSGNIVTGLTSNYAGDWAIYCGDFTGGNNNCSDNTIPTSLGGGIIAANAGDRLNFGSTVNSNSIGWMMGGGTNGTASGQFANGLYLDGFVNAVGNTITGAKYPIVCNNQETGVFSEVGCTASNNLVMEGRPVTVTVTGTSGTVVGQRDGFQTDKIYLTSGGSLAGASFSANVSACLPACTTAISSPTSLTVIPINGYPTAAGITDNGPTGNLTATVSTIVGPANYDLTLGSISGGAFGLFDDVTVGSGATQAHGIVGCSTSVQTSANCATNHYLISGILNASGLMVAFPATGTITDTTTGATATISARTTLAQNMQYALVGNNTDTAAGSIKFLNNTTYGWQLASVGGINSTTFSGTIGGGTTIFAPNSGGVVSPFGATLAFAGDSQTTGAAVSAGQDYPSQVMLQSNVTGRSNTKVVDATTGWTIQQLAADYTATLHPVSPAVTGKKGYLFVEIGGNNVLASESATTIEGRLTSYYTTVLADGWILVMETITPQGSGGALNAVIYAVNQWIRQQQTATTLFVDSGWMFPNPFDATVYSAADKLHLLAPAYVTWAAAINQLFGSGASMATGVPLSPLIAPPANYFATAADPGTCVVPVATGNSCSVQSWSNATDGQVSLVNTTAITGANTIFTLTFAHAFGSANISCVFGAGNISGAVAVYIAAAYTSAAGPTGYVYASASGLSLAGGTALINYHCATQQ